MMFPKTQDLSNATVAKNATVQMGKSFLFDFEKGEFIVRDGKFVECEGVESIKIWIEKILRTEKDRFKIYDGTSYGCHLEDLIVGSNFPVSFIESELRREVTEAILQNPQITGISNFKVERSTKSITVSMEVSTIYDAGTNTITVTL